MLKIYKDLFDDLNKNKITYCIYKGLNHLEEDLNGERGDIDILINKNNFNIFVKILRKNSIYLSSKSKSPYYFVGIDKDTHKFILIDMNTKIQFGSKPYKPFFIDINYDNLKICDNKNNIKLLDNKDYMPLMFLMRILSLSKKQKDLQELQMYLKENKLENSYIKNLLEKIMQKDWNYINEKIINSSSWNDLKYRFQEQVKANVKKDILLDIKQRFKSIFTRFSTIKKILKIPSYRIRKKGYLVAFIGVDGAGKSSTVDYICSLDYFKFTGVKRVYFGNNEYQIPALSFLLNKKYKNNYIRLFINGLTLIDRKFRIYIAKYYMIMGNIVVADRYYYDNIIAQKINKNFNKKRNIFKRIFLRLFQVNDIVRTPDLTIFLDVSPDVAYQRKQDYSYEKMIEVNKAYKNYMYGVEKVKIINADKTQKEIYYEVVDEILKLDRNV